MQRDCDNCKHAETPAFFEPCASCGGSSYWEPYVQTNGDRIRSMTDEELAKFMGELPCCPPGADVKELCYPMDACEGTDLQVQCWLDWLKQEAME